MQLHGIVKQLSSGSMSRFVLLADNGEETQVESSKALPPALKNGDRVVVTGTMPTDPPFQADSVTMESPRKPLWPWLAGAAALLVLIAVAVFFYLRKDVPLTVTAVQGTPAVPQANLPIHLLDQNQVVKSTAQTDASGVASFPHTPAGVYIVEFANPTSAAVLPVQWTGKGGTQMLRVTSPFTWTIRVGNCNQPVAHATVEITGAGQTRDATSDADGWVNFYNLPVGTYTAHTSALPTAPTTSVTLDGVAVLQPSQLGVGYPPCPVFIPRIAMRPPSALLQELKLNPGHFNR